jgi:regulator of replication initiation timing
MRKIILSLLAGACLIPTTSGFAKTSEEKLANAIDQLMQQTAELQKEVLSLRDELNQVKQENQQLASNQKTLPTRPAAKPGSRVNAANDDTQPVKGETPSSEAAQEKYEFISYLLGTPVITSPTLSVRSQFDAADLIVNYPGINEDLFFLRQQKRIADVIGYENLPSKNRPILALSGMIEALLSYQNPFGPGPTTNSLELSEVELDVYAEVSRWAHGFLSILFDSSTLDPNLTGSGNAANNGKLFIDRGFVTIGNMTKTPIYFSAGRMYVPFGRYSSNMYSNPVTKSLGRTNVNAALLGYATDNVNVAAYFFDGGTTVGQSGIGGWGANLGFTASNLEKETDVVLGVGFINNLADSQLAQSPSGGGFSANATTEKLQHVVPGVNVHAGASKGPFSFRSELVMATTSYATSDLTFNGSGASPKAVHAEAAYGFDIKERPSNISLGYGHTWEALGLSLPQNSYTATFNTSIWKNTVQTLEFRHDKNYASTDTAGMICDPMNTGIAGFCMMPPVPGSTQNSIFARLAVFF